MNEQKRRYQVIGHTMVTVYVEVDATSEDAALEAAYKTLPGLTAYVGNYGSADQLVGVDGDDQSIEANGDIAYEYAFVIDGDEEEIPDLDESEDLE